MKTSLDHLPEGKRRELERVVEILFAEFEDALKGRNAPHRKAGRILKVILFGSYARGDWVDDPKGGYKSDYDLLVVVNHEELADVLEYWRQADDHLLREYQISHRLSAPANFIVQSLTDVNQQLKRGRPFFVDIVRDGVALYEAPDQPFEQAAPLSSWDRVTEARHNFDEWFSSASNFAQLAAEAVAKGMSKEAAFLLHQATERLYHCLLLVLTLYSPKSHKLNFLRSHAERLAPALIDAWPRETRFQQRSWELLRRAYVDARYSPHYKISDEELTWLSERIRGLAGQVERLCCDHLSRLQAPPEEVGSWRIAGTIRRRVAERRPEALRVLALMAWIWQAPFGFDYRGTPATPTAMHTIVPRRVVMNPGEDGPAINNATMRMAATPAPTNSRAAADLT